MLERYRDFKATRNKLAQLLSGLKKVELASIAKGIAMFPFALLEVLFLGVLFWFGFLFKSLPAMLAKTVPVSLFGWLKFFVISVLLGSAVMLLALFTYLSYAPDVAVLKQYIQTHHFRTAVAMRDSKGI